MKIRGPDILVTDPSQRLLRGELDLVEGVADLKLQLAPHLVHSQVFDQVLKCPLSIVHMDRTAASTSSVVTSTWAAKFEHVDQRCTASIAGTSSRGTNRRDGSEGGDGPSVGAGGQAACRGVAAGPNHPIPADHDDAQQCRRSNKESQRLRRV